METNISYSVRRVPILAVVALLLLGRATSVEAQRVRIPSTSGNLAYQGGVSGGAQAGGQAGDAPLTPIPQRGATYDGGVLGQPAFDPYATNPGATTVVPQDSFGQNSFGGPGQAQGGPTYDGQPYCNPVPTQPPSLFPNGLGTPDLSSVMPDAGVIAGPPLRLIQGPRVRHTWLLGGDEQDLGINTTDVSAVITYPNFVFTGQPLFVAPSFSLHLWDGPDPTTGFFPPDADLPAQAYDAFIDAFWASDPNIAFGVETGVRVGIFSDFNTLNSDSLRIMGRGLVRYRLTPTLMVRGGVIYADRVDIKLVPAGGILWEPNPQTRFDIFFPQPKLSQYLTTLGNWDVWWYLAGEWGGGSWTIERAVDNRTDRVDLYDLRVIVGLEWGQPQLIRQGRRLAFLEAGWVLDREVIYDRRPQDSFTLDDTLMVRGGIAY